MMFVNQKTGTCVCPTCASTVDMTDYREVAGHFHPTQKTAHGCAVVASCFVCGSAACGAENAQCAACLREKRWFTFWAHVAVGFAPNLQRLIQKANHTVWVQVGLASAEVSYGEWRNVAKTVDAAEAVLATFGLDNEALADCEAVAKGQ